MARKLSCDGRFGMVCQPHSARLWWNEGIEKSKPAAAGCGQRLVEKNGDAEKNPLWQGFSPRLLKQLVPEDLEFRARGC